MGDKAVARTWITSLRPTRMNPKKVRLVASAKKSPRRNFHSVTFIVRNPRKRKRNVENGIQNQILRMITDHVDHDANGGLSMTMTSSSMVPAAKRRSPQKSLHVMSLIGVLTLVKLTKNL